MSGPRAGSGTASAVAFIARHQRADGAITWFLPPMPGGEFDPWDHVECAMALNVGGEHRRAAAAYRWFIDEQAADGSVAARYDDTGAVDRARDSNVSSYLAVGAWHHYLVTGDVDTLAEWWPAVVRAVDFACSLQAPGGEVHWAIGGGGAVWEDTQLTGASSVHAALRCAELAAGRLGDPAGERWAAARARLARALVTREEEFGRSFPEPPARFAMHWYYPVLGGVVAGAAGRERLLGGWSRFVEAERGCRCTDDRRWVTVAESSELVLALDACGERDRAREVLDWQLATQHPDGGFDTGTVPGYGPWPRGERPSWTAAAAVLAQDALTGISPGGELFRSLPQP